MQFNEIGFAQIKFIGPTEFATGEWIGVELDLAEGKNNGTVNSVRYWDGGERHGLFVKKAQVRVLIFFLPLCKNTVQISHTPCRATVALLHNASQTIQAKK